MFKNLIDVCETRYNVDIYIFNNNIENNKIDGNKIKHTDTFDYLLSVLNKRNIIFKEETQSSIDKKIKKKIKNHNIQLKMRSDYSPGTIENAIRQMYIEEQVGLFLENNQNKYDSSIVCSSDLYLLNKINLNDIEDSILNNAIYTTDNNEGNGYTNSFYIGKLERMVKILKRFSILQDLLPTNKDYEFLLKRAFDIHGIERKITEMLFFKIRNNNSIARQGKLRKKKYDDYYESTKKQINSL
jgi:hypothetical protein